MKKPCLRIIGDVHQQLKPYIELANEVEYSLQIGDLGFNYELLKTLDPEKHKVFGGNHDNYTAQDGKFIHMQTGHWLGDFGVYAIPEFISIFFVRGGYSVDRRYRVDGRDWFKDEELSAAKMNEALDLYCQVKPEFVCTHECPASIIDPLFGSFVWDGELIKPSRTAKLLDMMWNSHRPKIWVFGHFHKTRITEVEGTNFCCVPELGYMDIKNDVKHAIDVRT